MEGVVSQEMFQETRLSNINQEMPFRPGKLPVICRPCLPVVLCTSHVLPEQSHPLPFPAPHPSFTPRFSNGCVVLCGVVRSGFFSCAARTSTYSCQTLREVERAKVQYPLEYIGLKSCLIVRKGQAHSNIIELGLHTEQSKAPVGEGQYLLSWDYC